MDGHHSLHFLSMLPGRSLMLSVDVGLDDL